MLLGLVQGPAELMPVSSSGHLMLLGSRDKAFDVFLHAGSAAAMVVSFPLPRPSVRMAATALPAALAGLALERPIERRLGPRTVAFGQIAGGIALVLGDRAPERRGGNQAGLRDALLVGLAQALALVPGVSRTGAALTAARLLGFRRDAAAQLAREAGLPVIVGATALKLARTREARASAAHAAGFAAAFASGLMAARLGLHRGPGPLFSPAVGAYRVALGLIVLRSMRLNGRDG
ncbi:MAG TPA: undecaprenyl-diphosphate phosphatase [Thermoleophilaceae bacterium]|nr:undecaprenyl-diphosphate phosphatase [Thermoleophilaceae bacterium]